MNGNWRLKAIAPMCRLYYQNVELDGVTVPLPKGRGFPLHTEHTYARTKA